MNNSQIEIKKLKKISSINVKILHLINLKFRILMSAPRRSRLIVMNDYNVILNNLFNSKYSIKNNVDLFHLKNICHVRK